MCDNFPYQYVNSSLGAPGILIRDAALHPSQEAEHNPKLLVEKECYRGL